MLKELELPLCESGVRKGSLGSELARFDQFGSRSFVTETKSSDGRTTVPAYVNEFWTAGQRQAANLHEISYRACFKPQLPKFFIERLTAPGEVVYDPFMGRGTTLLEAALLGRVPYGNDINPLSLLLIKPRLNTPTLSEVAARLNEISFARDVALREDLLVFYHPETLREICSLRAYLLERAAENRLDAVDEWIRMVALNRLTGHSPGFFSVYTLPPNQAVSIKSQEKINRDRNQIPPRREVAKIILKKSKSLLADCAEELRAAGALLVNRHAAETSAIPSESVSLVVTSPPFLDVVDYAGDNWLRCWFAGIDAATVKLTVPKKLENWQAEMTRVFCELRRVLKVGGHVAFEVGEVRAGKVKLEETVLACGVEAGLKAELVLINQQEFTKTANCWGVANNAKGTNSNRIVVFRKTGSER
ncbi:MAG TPA: DNA methyltransferase [Verrucomicrobiae bacterium]